MDALCPRWGDYVNDTIILDDAAKVALLYDGKLQNLPRECRSLHAALVLMAEVAERLRIPDGAENNADTKESVRGARSSLTFGKRTVNVSAAIKLLFGVPINKAGIQAILAFKDSLPQALVIRLERCLDDPLATAAGSAGARAAAQKRKTASGSSGALKRAKSKSALNAEASASVKRSRSGGR